MSEALNHTLAFLKTRAILRRMRLSACATLLLSILFIFIAAFMPAKVKAQNPAVDIEEISVYLIIQGIGGYDINAIYKDGVIYLPITEMLQSLKINYRISESGDTISGFFLEEKNKYYVSKPGNSIFINDKLIQLTNDELINTENTSLALRIDQYGKLFGLDCRFDFSSLSVDLKTSQELPVIKELRLEQMRKNINRLRGEIVVDTTYKRKYHFFKGGMADWAIYSTQVANGPSNTRAMLGLGAEFLGGETDVLLNYSSKTGFDKKQQKYLWRWADNSAKLVKQVMLGTIASKSISSIYSPLVGAVVTNTPLSYRRSFGTYTISDFTEPGWTVELYINNVIVNYTTADARGFYKFDIPLVYGSSIVLVKFYGPWGEERTKEQIINVPYNFLPKGEMQYSISGAMEQDTSHSIFSRTEVSYGVSRHITMGGGFEYLSTITSGPSIPFINGSAQVLNNILFYAEYAYKVRNKAIVSYSLPSGLSFEANWAKYTPGQTAIIYNYLEERKLSASIPINFKKIKIYSRASYIQNILPESIYSSTEATLSTYYKGVSANFTANANWLENSKAYIYGNLGLGFRFFNTLSVRPQAQFDFTNNSMIFTKLELENNFSPKVNLSLLWEDNFSNNINSLELIFRYNFSFARTSLSTRVSKNYFISSESAQGSIAFGSGNGRVIAGQTQQVGKAGLTIIPFLDINNNNLREDDEPITFGMDMRINGGRIVPSTKDSIIRIIDLEAFSSYMLEFSDTQFDNIAWQIPNKTISILMDPNQFKLLEVPIKVMGEINGMVYLKTGLNLKGQDRVVVNIINDEGIIVSKTQSESDGYFSYLGLAPGSYHAEVDSMQLVRLKSVSTPNRFDFEIQPSINGDIIDNIEFVLSKQTAKIEEITSIEPKKEEIKPVVEVAAVAEPKKEEIKPVVKEELPVVIKPAEKIETPKEEVVVVTLPAEITNKPTESHKFFIQAGAFIKPSNAERLKKDLSKRTSEKWFIVKEGDFYKVRLGYFDSKQVADDLKEKLDTPEMAYYISEIPLGATSDLPYVASENVQTKQVTTKEPKQAKQAQAKVTEKGAVIKDDLYKDASVMDCEDSLHPQTGYFIQAGAFAIKSNAERLTAKLIATTGQNWFIACGQGLYKVRLGYFATKKEAKDLQEKLKGSSIEFYVNKPKGIIIKDQPADKSEIAAQKQKAQTVPVQTPDVKEKKATEPVTVQTVPVQTPVVKEEKAAEQVISKPLEKAVIIAPAVNNLPETAKTEEKATKKSKDGIVLTPPIDDLNMEAQPIKYYIQAGAFESKEHAQRLTQDLIGLTLKRWFIVYENGLYKVQLGYFKTKEAAKALEGTLNTTEVPYYLGGVIPGADLKNNNSGDKDKKRKSETKESQPAKKQEIKPEEPKSNKKNETDPALINKSNATAKETEKPETSDKKSLIETPPNDNKINTYGPHKFFIQANAMSNKAIAEQIAADLSAKTRKNWFIVFEDNLYKVRIGYFESKDEAKYVVGTLNTPDISYYIDEVPEGKSDY